MYAIWRHYLVNLRMRKRACALVPIIFIFFFHIPCTKAQYDAPLYTSYTTTAARAKLHDRLIKNSIIRNLNVPLTDTTEENWQDAFNGMELLLYKTSFTNDKIDAAFRDFENRTVEFQRSFLEVVYALYPEEYAEQLILISERTDDLTVFAICVEYILQKKSTDIIQQLSFTLQSHFSFEFSNPMYSAVLERIHEALNGSRKFISKPELKLVLGSGFLPGNVVMYSFHRKNRDYPGLVLVRNAFGGFSTDSSGAIFTVPQLARSISNLPYYLKGGNTPQGIFLMYGFGVSMNSFIGPSANVQMGMPVELTIKQFLRDSTISDTVWNPIFYERLLPPKLKDCTPLHESYTAGAAGRNEIIAHGTAIDPEYYLTQIYYPLTPSRGCLGTAEVWNGKRISSDQQKLVNALLQAGGADGYCVVIEIDDANRPVVIEDILPFLPM